MSNALMSCIAIAHSNKGFEKNTYLESLLKDLFRLSKKLILS
jgi:hypothetical protein